MGYLILILGVALWSGAHLFKRLAPERRAAMGDAAKGPVALALVLSIVLMVIGYRWAEPVWLWYPPPVPAPRQQPAGLRWLLPFRRLLHPQHGHPLHPPPAAVGRQGLGRRAPSRRADAGRAHPLRRAPGLGGGVGHPHQPVAAELDPAPPRHRRAGGRHGAHRAGRHLRRRLDPWLARRLALRVTR